MQVCGEVKSLGQLHLYSNPSQIVILRSEATKNLVLTMDNEILRSLRSLRMTNSQSTRINAIALVKSPCVYPFRPV